MGLRSTLLSGRFRARRALMRACRLGALTALAVAFAPSRGVAQSTQSCPGTITTNTTLSGDITAAAGGPNPCIVIGADNLTVNLAGHTVNVTALGNSAVAIGTGATNNTTIVSGTIITAYASDSTAAAIDSEGGTNLTVSGVTLDNEPTGSLCTANMSSLGTSLNYGTGISVNGSSGANISGNRAYCYQVGISVQNGAIPRKGTGTISGNLLEGNVYNMVTAQQGGVYSAGLVLANSSGWSVTGNVIEYNGSEDTSYTCVSNGTTEISCAFGLQIINGSSNNSITNNTVDANFIGGIYTGPATARNKIIGNTALNNVWDLYDDSPGHGNAWRKNVCYTSGGSVSPQKCPSR